MLRNITKKLFATTSKDEIIFCLGRNLSYAQEVISTDDQNLFPPEEGIIQNSIYGQKITIPKCTLDQYIWMDLDKFKHKTAVECGITGRSYTYEKLRGLCATFAVHLLKKHDLRNGDTVGLCLPNIPEFVVAALGSIEAGFILSTLNPIYTSEEISKQLINSNTKILIGSIDNYDTLSKAIEMSKMNIPLVMVKTEVGQSLPRNTIDFNDLLNTAHISYEVLNNCRSFDFNDTIMLPYSSGTTGLPKGVELTHRNFVSNSEMLNHNIGAERLILETSDTHQDILPCVLPFFHAYGWGCTLTTKLKLGCKLVTLPSFKPDTFIKLLSNHKATVLHLVPPIVIFLNNCPDITSKHLSSLRMVMSGAAPLGGSDVERFMQKAPNVQFSQGYGLTETSPVAMMQAIGSKNFASVGSPSPATQAKIVKLDDNELVGVGAEITGEILVRGPHIMKGYYKNESATNETIVKNGWLRTGDIGYYDKDFQFYITDRMKELIKVKGFQVAPAELEEILRSHPHVADAAVIGIPNKTTGELPRGYIVGKPNVKINEQDILNFVKDKVAAYKRLESVVLVDSIPKNATGKIMRRQLKLQFIQNQH